MPCGERVPLTYANQALQETARHTKFFHKSRRYWQMSIIQGLKEELGVEKAAKGRGRGRVRSYTVCKEKVDAMDWELWCLIDDHEVDV